MGFKEFINKGWADHANSPKAVAERFPEGISLLETNEQVPALAGLITHVMGEHLREWSKGVSLLQKLQSSPAYVAATESEAAIVRSIASLELAGEIRGSIAEFSLSDQIRILAVAASALSEKNAARAQELFRSALAKADQDLPKADGANRALAITGNNLASALEEKPERSSAETELMILAAQSARKYWEIAGGWMETERAEYRLSQTYIKAGLPDEAVKHAQNCLTICNQNNADALELFFAYETLALSEKARNNIKGFTGAVAAAEDFYSRLSDDNKPWCESSLKKLKE